MDADFSIELGEDDPVLDFPWEDPAGKPAYVDLKRHPEMLETIEEAEAHTELGQFLRAMNSAESIMESAKCDAWATTELDAEEEIYEASHKFASYVDLLFSSGEARLSFLGHERFARELVALLRGAPELAGVAEVCVRRCYVREEAGVGEGFYFTLYVSGYGKDEPGAYMNWETGLKLMSKAVARLAARWVVALDE